MKKYFLYTVSLTHFSYPRMKDFLDKNHYDFIIDVRTEEEYESGHIQNALHIPLDKIQDFNGDKSKKIAVYCRSGNRSAQAKAILEEMGCKDVTNIGGVIDGSTALIK